MAVDGEKMSLQAFRRGLKALEKETWDMIYNLVGPGSLTEGFPNHPVDHHNVFDLDYSFLNHLPSRVNSIIRRIHSAHPELPMGDLDDSGHFFWNNAGISALISKMGQINMNISFLTFFTAAISSRVTEHLEHKLRNSLKPRNLYAFLDSLFILKMYSKTSNLVGADVCEPLFPPTAVSDLLLAFYGGGIRDVEEVFVGLFMVINRAWNTERT